MQQYYFTLQAPGVEEGAHTAGLDDQVTQLAVLQEELKDGQRVLAQLEEAGSALEAGASEYDHLVKDLRERKERHSALKARNRELKQVKRQHQAKERALKELLEL